MRRMFTEEAFNSLGNDVDNLKNKHLYIHQIKADITDTSRSYTGTLTLNIINTSNDELTIDFDTFKNGLKNYIYTNVYDASNDCIGQISTITDTIDIYLNYGDNWVEYEFDTLNTTYSSDTVIQLI